MDDFVKMDLVLACMASMAKTQSNAEMMLIRVRLRTYLKSSSSF